MKLSLTHHLSQPSLLRTSSTIVATCLIVVCVLVGASLPSFAQSYTDLYDFNTADPTFFDSGRLAQGRDGNFYAESANGGTSALGAVFKLTPSGTLTTIHSLTQADGSNPHGGMTLGLDGNLYGDTVTNGTNGSGTIIKVTPAGLLTVLHVTSGLVGAAYNALVLTHDGNFYGTTNNNPETIYRVTSAGVYTTIHTLSSSEGFQGAQLSLGSDGLLYGAMNLGGANGHGTAFKVTTAGAFTVLHNFTAADGQNAAGGNGASQQWYILRRR